jgi:delta24-sterol reductase
MPKSSRTPSLAGQALALANTVALAFARTAVAFIFFAYGLAMKLPFAPKVRGMAVEFMTEQRGWFVIFFVLPISLCFDILFAIRAVIIRKLFSAPLLHAERVADVQEQVRARSAGSKLCTARGGWQSISPGYRTYKQHSTKISIDMYDILSWDESAMTITVEPMVTMGDISHFLISKGYTLPVLPEMDDLTVGGLYMGVGIETSSHRYGLFNDCVLSSEIVLASGEVVNCSPGENKDLFDALPWSYGTLGFLTSVTLRIIPCKQFVAVRYVPCHTQEQGAKSFTAYSEAKDAPDFVEALSMSATSMVVMPAYFTDGTPADLARLSGGAQVTKNTLSWWFKPWFYKHVEWMLSDGKGERWEVIPLRDYYHRHTKSIFWELEQIIPVGNHPIFRLALGWAVPPKVSFLKLTQTEALQKMYEEQHVIQDMLVPLPKMSEALDVFEEEYSLYPLWICPYRAYDYGSSADGSQHRCFLRKPTMANKMDEVTGQKYEMYVDLGAYGIPKAVLEKKPFDAPARGAAVESYVMSVRGFQMLYADSYLTKKDFYAMFDHSHYGEMKRKFDPDNAFPEVFDKVCKKAAYTGKVESKKEN